MNTQRLTPEQAVPKIRYYCNYQERCHAEVRNKLYSYGLRRDDVEKIIVDLITANFLNEERFAILFAGGKFRMKHWGKNKILLSLRQKDVSNYCIKKALKAIDEDDYLKTFNKLVVEKLKTLKSEKNIFIKKRKLKDFLIQKGFESSLVFDAVNNL